ncbi:MAG: argininosuccinate lyase, partial [Acidobacteriota bacterium]
SPKHFVEIRRTPGGPAPAETALALGESKNRLHDDRAWLQDRVDRLKEAQEELQRRSAAL